ncbi:radical SAM protein [Caloramator sp. Dgby_cultured_2]|uniref:radical SAM protein n=1 Tax=Caloramator sp. Dgby_cultured_2 TaxID=3029174 RepID=UPI0031594A47
MKHSNGGCMKGVRVIVTYQCNFLCHHCRFRCAPYKRGFMNQDEFEDKVLEAINEGYNNYIIIEGGEVFLNPSMLFRYLKKIKDIDIKKYVITNGSWGNLDIYFRILKDLKGFGLSGIILEYDYFHKPFIDEDKLKDAIDKVLKNDLELILKGILLTDDISTYEDIETLKEIKKLMDKKINKVIFESIETKFKTEIYKRWTVDEKLILFKNNA